MNSQDSIGLIHDIGSDAFIEVLKNSVDQSSYKDSSRIGPYKNVVGSYSQIIYASEKVVNPGDTITIDFFIGGYGRIDGAKLNVVGDTDIPAKLTFTEQFSTWKRRKW